MVVGLVGLVRNHHAGPEGAPEVGARENPQVGVGVPRGSGAHRQAQGHDALRAGLVDVAGGRVGPEQAARRRAGQNPRVLVDRQRIHIGAGQVVRRDAVAVIVALGLAVSLVLLAGAAAWAEAGKNRVLSEAAASLLSTVLGAVVGAVATYLGLRPSEGDGAKASTRE